MDNTRKHRPAAVVATCVFLFVSSTYGQQVVVPRIEQMPNFPSPYAMRNWKQVALGYDSLAFDLNRVGQYLPLVSLITNSTNYPGQTGFGLHTYVGDGRTGNGEAINVLPAVLGATLCGVDKSNQNGKNWVLMCQEFFNNRPAENVYLNAPVASSGSDWWYDVMPNVFFYTLYSAYPGIGDSRRQFVSVADRWLQAVLAMGGSLTPWSHPGLEHRGWHLATMTPNNELPHEPEAGGSIAWLLYAASVVTGNRTYRSAAELCLEELNAYTTNPAYELQLSYGTYLAARMNAEVGTSFDVAKMVNWCFDVSPIRSWGAMVGRWGGYDCAGLRGEVNYSNDYAFAMNTFQQIGALVPLVRYDPRFARAIGKWVLNAANASRLFYSNQLPDAHQDGRQWSRAYDSASVIAYEALRQYGPMQVAPFATGDAVRGGWAATNLSLYSSSHVGILGAIIDTTNIPGILKLDLLKTDYFHRPAYPSFLLYNPDSNSHNVQITVGNDLCDVYDAVSKAFIVRGRSGTVSLPLQANSACAVVIVPAQGVLTYDEERMLVNGTVVDYHSSHTPSNHRPRIKGLGANPGTLYRGGSTTLYCTGSDRDGDTLSYLWSASAGSLTGAGSSVTWSAPVSKGTFAVTCRILDSRGGTDSASVSIRVVDSALSVPRIVGLVARPSEIDRGASTTVSCQATDSLGLPLSYSWRVAAGTITGSDTSVQWTAPPAEGNWYVVCRVDNGQGGNATDSVLIPVRDFSHPGNGQLLLYLPFSGNSNDQSGFSNQCVPTDLIYVADRFGTEGQACGFNGATSSVRIRNTPTLSCDSAITVGLWMKPGIFSGKEMFLISHGSWQNRWKISLTPERRLRWTVKTTTGVKDLDSRTVVSSSTYYFVAGIYTGTELKLYVQGEFENLAGWSGKVLTLSIDLMVGQMLPGDANYNFHGVIDDIRIYNAALTYPQIQNLMQITSSVSDQTVSPLPVETRLTGNFPNPFNPRTEIRFDIGSRRGQEGTMAVASSRVALRVYDVMGREAATLFEGDLVPGRYAIPFDASGHASGIYFCRLTAEGRSDVVKMLLVR